MSDILINKNLSLLQDIIDNPNYKEIVISKPYHISIENMQGGWIYLKNEQLSLQYLFGISRLLAIKEGKKFNESNPILSATIYNKHRVNVIYGKQTNHDISMTIRLKRNSDISLNQFNISEQAKDFLINLVRQKKNIIISGGTGTGKTTLLNALAKFIDSSERIVTIENVREIELDNQNHDALIYLEDSQEKIATLLNSALRMRPDRILIGELRMENSYIFLRSINTGHEGTIATIHASDAKGAIEALIHNIKSSTDINHQENTIRKELHRNIDAIVQLKREYIDNKMRVSIKITLPKS